MRCVHVHPSLPLTLSGNEGRSQGDLPSTLPLQCRGENLILAFIDNQETYPLHFPSNAEVRILFQLFKIVDNQYWYMKHMAILLVIPMLHIVCTVF